MSECQVSMEPPSRAYGFVQWKGMSACVDLNCLCGALLHSDAEFLYSFVCPHCGQKYEMGHFVSLYPVDEFCRWHDNPKLVDPDEGMPLMRKEGLEP